MGVVTPSDARRPAHAAEVIAAPRLRLHVEHARLGELDRGEEVTVTYHDDDVLSFEPPGRGTFTWREAGDVPRAQMCDAPERAPGCSRCSGGEQDISSSFWLAFSIAVLRTRRRR
ncbi:MAG: hypothetical protein KF773_17465 [Deltaproteobacteria bacterium]|nr:hypothetical protein [Deltaproteobacteria bacterium]